MPKAFELASRMETSVRQMFGNLGSREYAGYKIGLGIESLDFRLVRIESRHAVPHIRETKRQGQSYITTTDNTNLDVLACKEFRISMFVHFTSPFFLYIFSLAKRVQVLRAFNNNDTLFGDVSRLDVCSLCIRSATGGQLSSG